MRNLFLLCCVLMWADAAAQDAEDYPFSDVAHVEKSLDRKAVTISYANDVFVQTDRYFTQGVEVSLRHPALRRFDLLRVLSQEKDNGIYALGFYLDAYTPSTIRADSILSGDRPYSATAALKLDCTSFDAERKSCFHSTLMLGVIGPVAQGREIQTAIHRATDDFIPLGWQYQVQNDLLLNYTLQYQRELIDTRLMSLFANGSADAGTLRCSLGAGFSGVLRPLARIRSGIKPSIRAAVTGFAVGYDARLQGGVFNRSSPYVLRANEISRTVGHAHIQIRFDYRRTGIGAERAWVTREFETGAPHGWGRLFVQYYF